MAEIRVVLPAPLGPSKAIISPSVIFRFMSSRATVPSL